MFTEGRNHGITDLRNYGITEGQAESSIAPLFQSGAIKMDKLADVGYSRDSKLNPFNELDSFLA